MTIQQTKVISLFWYKRLCEITFFISLLIVLLFAASAQLFGDTHALLIPLPVAILACFTAALAIAAYIWLPKVHAYAFSLIPYGCLAVTVGVLCGLTGGIDSPYLPLWMLVAVFSGIFGRSVLLIFALTAAVTLVDRMLEPGGMQQEEFITSALAGGVPVITSYLIWHEKTNQQNRKQKTVEALTQQLSQVANKSDIVINSIADGVLAIDETGVIQVINPAAQAIIGWSRDDALQLDYHSVFRLADAKGNDVPEGANPIQQVLYSNQLAASDNLTLATKSGKRLDISLLVSPVPAKEGSSTAVGVIAVFRDITDQKRQQRAQAEFISTASHEMRTPVAAIEGYLSLALNPATASIDDKARAYLQKAHESTEHLGRLFQDLLTVSRAEDGRLAPKPVVVDIVAFAREITDGLSAKATAKGLNLQFAVGGGLAAGKTVAPAYYTYLDRDHLREVIGNLVDNAIKYTKAGGVTLDITSAPDSITISIADTGIGIPPEDVPHLFQKFYRVDESYTREVGGTGLGLYICRRLIENNNGKVWAESDYGHGSTFFVQVPRITHEKAAELGQQAANPPALGLAGSVLGAPTLAAQPATMPAATAAPGNPAPPAA